jgi:hypothetical protein
MKKLITAIALSIPVVIMWSCTSSSTAKDNQEAIPSIEAKNTVVLELFTSQGCSSCPPADKLLGRYTGKQNVIPLSFHVDYWDRLGWKDPFSSHDYSERQYRYATALKSQVYTPQLVINGDTQFVGSEAGKIASAIDQQLRQEPAAHLSLQKTVVDKNTINIAFVVSGNIANSLLNIALVEKKAVTDIGDGENRGATLTEYNIVREFKTIDSVKEGNDSLVLTFPPTLEPTNRQLVLFLQQKNDKKIIAADAGEF